LHQSRQPVADEPQLAERTAGERIAIDAFAKVRERRKNARTASGVLV